MDARLLDILVCPICKGNLEYRKAEKELVCKPCKLAHKLELVIEGGIINDGPNAQRSFGICLGRKFSAEPANSV